MKHWLLATAGGCLLGVLLYACVRLRMLVGPRIRERFGNAYRKAYWVFTVALMVALANLGLAVMRMIMADYVGSVGPVFLEAWFALTALAVGLLLVFGRMWGRH